MPHHRPPGAQPAEQHSAQQQHQCSACRKRQQAILGAIECSEIFYSGFEGGAGWMAAPVTLDPEPRVGAPALAFEAEYVDTRGRSFAVTSDGQRLYAVMPTAPPERNRVRLITNLRTELERLLPTP